MGNVIPWSQIHPSIKSEEPFVGVIMIDPQGEICIIDLVHIDPENMANPELVASQIIAAAQQAAAVVASSYRGSRKPARVKGLRLLQGGAA